MPITVRLSDLLQTVAGIRGPLSITGHTPAECLQNLTAQYPRLRSWLYDEKGHLKPQIWLLVNGERIYATEMQRPLGEGDELFVIVAVLGG